MYYRRPDWKNQNPEMSGQTMQERIRRNYTDNHHYKEWMSWSLQTSNKIGAKRLELNKMIDSLKQRNAAIQQDITDCARYLRICEQIKFRGGDPDDYFEQYKDLDAGIQNMNALPVANPTKKLNPIKRMLLAHLESGARDEIIRSEKEAVAMELSVERNKQDVLEVEVEDRLNRRELQNMNNAKLGHPRVGSPAPGGSIVEMPQYQGVVNMIKAGKSFKLAADIILDQKCTRLHQINQCRIIAEEQKKHIQRARRVDMWRRYHDEKRELKVHEAELVTGRWKLTGVRPKRPRTILHDLFEYGAKKSEWLETPDGYDDTAATLKVIIGQVHRKRVLRYQASTERSRITIL